MAYYVAHRIVPYYILSSLLLMVDVIFYMYRSVFAAPSQGIWLYSLLASLEKPVYRDMAALLRQLYTTSRELRDELCLAYDSTTASAAATGADIGIHRESDSSSSSMLYEQLSVLNTLIAITGNYFGQGEEYDSRQFIEQSKEATEGAVYLLGMMVDEYNGHNSEGEEYEDDEKEGPAVEACKPESYAYSTQQELEEGEVDS